MKPVRPYLTHRQFVTQFKHNLPSLTSDDNVARRTGWNDMVDYYVKAGRLHPDTEWAIPHSLLKKVAKS
jgi:hypothetical protein